MDSPTQLYPLRFKPLFREYIWGGRRLGTQLNKPIGAGPTYAESWEIVDHGGDQSVIAYGIHAGKTLGDLVRSNPIELLGNNIAAEIADSTLPVNLQNRFPLLFKFLDANQNLSVQVHPDDKMGATLPEPDLGKTEAWIVMAAAPGSKVYAGLKTGIDQTEFRKSIEENRSEEVLHSFEPSVGQCIFIPAGTVHALGEGLLIAEIQQCSNTTFRLYDWGRVDAAGIGRELHIDSGIAATDFSLGPVSPCSPVEIDSNNEVVVECDKFRVVRSTLRERKRISTDGSFKIIVVISGEFRIEGDLSSELMRMGCTALIPASVENFEILIPESCKEAEFLIISA